MNPQQSIPDFMYQNHNLYTHLAGKIVGVARVADGFHIVLHTEHMEDVYLCSKGTATVQVQPSPHEDPPFRPIPSTFIPKKVLEVQRTAESFTKTAQRVSTDFVVEFVTSEQGWFLRDLKGRVPEVKVWDRKQVRRAALEIMFGLTAEEEGLDFDSLFPEGSLQEVNEELDAMGQEAL